MTDKEPLVLKIVDTGLEIDSTHDPGFAKIIRWEGRIAISLSIMIFLILILIRFVFGILEHKHYVFIAVINSSLFVFGLGMLCFKRLSYCERSSPYFTSIFYFILYLYLVVLVAVGFDAFGCIRCIYGLLGIASIIPMIIITIRFTIVKLQNKKISHCFSVTGCLFIGLNCTKSCMCCRRNTFVHIKTTSHAEAFSITDDDTVELTTVALFDSKSRF
jgi:hypothetical protein